LAMAIRIKSGGSHFWKSCSINLHRRAQKKGRLSAALFF